MKKIFLTLACILTITVIHAQFDVEYVTPTEAVELLTGGGVEPFNITYSGTANQLGFLTNAEDTDFPIGQGIILGAADVSCSGGGGGNGTGTDADLLAIANSVPPLIGQSFTVSSVNDICILEFDFIAAGNTVSFDYVFGSDEYLTWVNSQYNDVFAFLMSGPGIVGEYASPPGFPDGAINLAIVPESDPELPITISSVNNVLNSEYFILNSDSDVCSNGYTTELTVNQDVICGETYHIKLAIADGSDTALESIVVLEAGSFDSNGVFITADPTVEGSVEFANDSLLVEGCNEGFFTLFRADATIDETIAYTISGTATPDVDYPELSGSVFFAAGEFAAEVNVLAYDDGDDGEPLEDITLSYTFINTCGDEVTTSASLWIADHVAPLLDPTDLTLYCGISYLTVPVIDGFGPFTWEWSLNTDPDWSSTAEGVLVDSDIDLIYTVIVTDPCGLTDEASVNVLVTDGDPPALELGNGPWVLDCPGDFITIDPDIQGGAPSFFFLWDGLGGWDQPTYTSSFGESTTLNITVADQCGQIEEFELDIVVPEYVPIVVTPEGATVPCAGVETEICASAENGFAPLEFFWGEFGEGSCIDVVPTETTSYTVQVQDACNNIVSSQVLVEVGAPDAIVVEPIIPECLNLTQPLVVSGGLSPYTFSFPDGSMIVDEGTITGTSVGFWELTVTDACGQTQNAPVSVIGCETVAPNIFTPGNGDILNETFTIVGLDAFPNSKILIYNRWGELIYENENYQNEWNGEDYADGTYYYVLQRSDDVTNSGYFQIVRGK